jgi:hypothetical protein
MKIEMISRGNATHVYHVQLEGEEYDWPDARIITAVDRRGNLTEQEWERIANGEDHPCHFGGTVLPYARKKGFEVKVYVD